MIWSALNGLYDRVRSLPHVGACLLGCALVRAWLGLVLAWIRGCSIPIGTMAPSAHLVLSLGECAGFLAVFAVARGGRLLRTHAGSLGLVAVGGVVGSLGLVAMTSGAIASSALMGIVCLLCGGVYAVGLMVWLEIYGQLSTERAVLAWAGSYLVNGALWLVFQDGGHGLQTVCLVGFPLVAVLLAVPAARWKDGVAGAPCDDSAGLPAIPWLLLLWVAVFGFLYGLGDAATGLAFSTLPARLGMAVPATVALLGITFGARRFDFKALAIMAVVGMTVGMVVVFGLDGNAVVSQLCMSAANESYLMFAYAFACAVAFRTRSSAALIGGLIGGCNILMVQVGSTAGALLMAPMADSRLLQIVVGVAAIVAALVVSAAAVYNRDCLDSLVDASQDAKRARLMAVAGELGLSPKETAVFMLLAQNRSISQIADELFLAPGTIRAHTSNVYRKMDVHTRADFLERVRVLEGEGARSHA